jgi:hypothetical protein
MPLAILRPDEWDFPLLVHVLGAMLLVGTLTVALTILVGAWRRKGDPTEAAAMRRVGFQTLLVAAIPSYVVMRVGAEWIASEEELDEAEAEWVDVGYITADIGAVVLIAATAVAWVAVRRGAAGGPLGRVSAVLVGVLIAAYLVAVWVMTTKPGQ